MSTNTALLVIDMQCALVEEASGPQPVLERIGGLLAEARATGTPVIFIQHEEQDYPPMNYGASGWQIHPSIAPAEGEPALRKRTADSFYETPLAAELEQRGITRLVVTGMQTDHCVNATCRSAINRGYDVTLVADAHTTADGEQLSAAQIIANYNQELSSLTDGGHKITVTPTAEITF